MRDWLRLSIPWKGIATRKLHQRGKGVCGWSLQGVWVEQTFLSGPQFWGMWAMAHAIVSPLHFHQYFVKALF